MSRTAARIWIVSISIFIVAVGLSAVALTLLGITWSLAMGGFYSGLLTLLWLAAWVIYFKWA